MCKEERERDKEAAGASERLEGAVDGGRPVAQEPSLNVASELQVLGRIDLGIFEKKYASIFHVFFLIQVISDYMKLSYSSHKTVRIWKVNGIRKDNLAFVQNQESVQYLSTCNRLVNIQVPRVER